MKKTVVLCLILFILIATMAGCGSEKPVDSAANGESSGDSTQSAQSPESDSTSNSGLVSCEAVYKGAELSYHVLGVRTKEYTDGVKNLILKLEVLNHSNSEISFSGFDRLTVFGSDKTEYMINLMADVEASLSGKILPDKKIMGEVAFEITDSNDDNYILHVGKSFEYDPAIEIHSSDINLTFAEKFESSDMVSEYTIGVPVESEQLTILLKNATTKPSDHESEEMLLCELDITNNTNESQSFMLGFNLLGAYTSDGQKLENEVNDYTLPTMVEPNETINGIIPFSCESGKRAFYITVIPNLKEFKNAVNIVFTAE